MVESNPNVFANSSDFDENAKKHFVGRNDRSTIILGLLCDLLWSDPDKDVQGWGENDRGVSFTFGSDVVSKFLNRHDLDLICRAHQVSNYLIIHFLHCLNCPHKPY